MFLPSESYSGKLTVSWLPQALNNELLAGIASLKNLFGRTISAKKKEKKNKDRYAIMRPRLIGLVTHAKLSRSILYHLLPYCYICKALKH